MSARPPKLPLIGNFHQLHNGGELLHITLAKMAQEYGPIMMILLGGWTPAIVVNNLEQAWEVPVTQSSDYASRELPFSSRFFSANLHTIATSNFGPYWDTPQKGLQGNALSPLQVTNQAEEQQRDVEAMVEAFVFEALKNARMFGPIVHLQYAIVRLVARLILGITIDDKFVEDIDEVLEEAIRLGGSARIVDAFPIARFIPGFSLTPHEVKVKPMIEKPIKPFLSKPKPNTFLQFLFSHNLPELVVIYIVFEVFLLAVDCVGIIVSLF